MLDYLFSWSTFLELFGVITGFAVLWLELKQRPSMWLLNMACSLLYIGVYLHAAIYAKAAFNLYYVLMSLYGLLLWHRRLGNGKKKEKGEKHEIEYVHLGWRQALLYLAASLCIFALIYFVLVHFTNSHTPWPDAFCTTLNIVGTYILARRIIEVWFVWVAENAVSLYLYVESGLYLTVLLYACYLLAAFWGYCTWKKEGKEIKNDSHLK